MENHNHITGCSGSAVKRRHCPATVRDEAPTVDNHCAQREGDRGVPSQETGPVNTPDFRGGVYAQCSRSSTSASAVNSGVGG